MELLQQERLAGASLLIFANKQDIVGALNMDQIVEGLGLASNRRFEKRHWKIQSCSAVSGMGLLHGMDWIVQDIGSRVFMLS